MAVKTPISPKVIVATVAAAAADALLAILQAVTPDSLAFLGHWSGLAYIVVSGIAAAIGGYVPSDPLRNVGAEAEAAGGADGTPPTEYKGTFGGKRSALK